jgi:hypothetical protein
MKGQLDMVNLAEKVSPFDEYWSPKIVARVNDYDVQVVKPRPPFPTLSCSWPVFELVNPHFRLPPLDACKTA